MSSQDEVEEFAALLRHLKGRTDRSYSALARRLNMNASTLHRYCSGEAVPLGFASVEKFAAMCGASAAERVELHRLWILATAARQRSRTTAGTGSARPGPTAADSVPPGPPASTSTPLSASGPASAIPSVPEPEPDAPGSPPVTTEATRPVVGTGPDASETLAPEAARNAAEAGRPEAGPDSAAALLPTSGQDVGTTLPPTAGQDTAETPPPDTDLTPVTGERPAEGSLGSSPERSGTPRTRRFRRRAAVVTAAVVTALIATLGSLSALPSGHSAKDTGGRAADAPNAKAADARRGSATPSASPSATHGRPSGSPAPSASGSRGASPSPSTSPTPVAGSAVTPLTWTADSHRWATGCFHDYVIDKTPEQVPPPPAPQDASPWARTQNAVHGGQMFVDITVQGRTGAAVVLEALRVRVVGRSAPLKGSVYSTGQGCGSDLAPHSFIVDLDKNQPIARAVSGNDSGTVTPPMSMPYRVSVTDPEALTIDARTGGCDCSWYLELDWSSQGRTGTERIDDDGRPFRTSGTKGLPRYWYAHDGWTLS